MYDFATELYLLENEPRAGRQLLLQTHRPPFGWPSESPGRVGSPEARRPLQPPCQDLAQLARRPYASSEHAKCARAEILRVGGHGSARWRPRKSGSGASFVQPPETEWTGA